MNIDYDQSSELTFLDTDDNELTQDQLTQQSNGLDGFGSQSDEQFGSAYKSKEDLVSISRVYNNEIN